MFSQSADENAPDQSPAPVGMRELPPQPARPVMPAFPTTPASTVTTTSDQPGDEAGPGPDDSVIARDDHFEGTFTSRGTVRVEGSVNGRIEAARVRIQEGATVEADVVVDEAIVAGEFTGNLTCRQRLEARPTGQINGRVETFKLMLHEGASVEGEMHMLPDPGASGTETIRGSASLRGETSAPAADTQPKDPAIRTATKTSSPAPSTSTSTQAKSSVTTPAGTPPRETSRPEAKATTAVDSGMRVKPRAATAVSAGSSSNGTTAEGNASRL